MAQCGSIFTSDVIRRQTGGLRLAMARFLGIAPVFCRICRLHGTSADFFLRRNFLAAGAQVSSLIRCRSAPVAGIAPPPW